MEIELFSVWLYSFEHKAYFSVLLFLAVHVVSLECQTRILILGISEKRCVEDSCWKVVEEMCVRKDFEEISF